MKNLYAGLLLALTLAASLLAPQQAFASLVTGQVGQIEYDSRSCTFFTISGLWYAISNTMPNYEAVQASLLTAKAAGITIMVNTSGTSLCSTTGVDVVVLM